MTCLAAHLIKTSTLSGRFAQVSDIIEWSRLEELSRVTQENTQPPDRPGAEWVQADIARAFELRRDYYKYSIGVATALLAFTISFPPSLSRLACPKLIFVAWPALGVAILCGIAVHYVWAWFFISFRNLDSRFKTDDGRALRKKLNRIRKTLEVVQIVALVVGVLGSALFASINIENVALKTDEKASLSTPVKRP